MANPTNATKNVLVVGGGGAGAQVARSLSAKLDPKKYSLILVSAREYSLHLPATIRMIVTERGKLEDTVLIPYDKLFHNGHGTFHPGVVTSIVADPGGRGGHVVTEDGGEIKFEVLVLATGSHWEGGIDLPPKKDDAVRFIQGWRTKFKDAKSVVMVGGGAVGIEMAGEIRDIYPEKKITIVHDKKNLLTDVYPVKFRVDMENRLKKRNITLVLDDSIQDIPPEGAEQAVTSKGVKIDADLVVPTRGGRPNTAFVASLGSTLLNSEGYVKVDPTLQVSGFPSIFAAGDIIDWKEVKQLAKYGGHASTVTSNALSYLNGKPTSVKYKSMFEGIFITNGASGGGAWMDVMGGLRFGDRVSKMVKSKDLFISGTRKNLGYT